MGKSIRSKWRRKMRNVKREKYAVKEMDRLKRITGLTLQQDEEMKDLYKVKTAKEVLENKDKEEDNGMDVDKQSKKYNSRTLKDEHGSYPAWMNHRAIKKNKKKEQFKKQKKAMKK